MNDNMTSDKRKEKKQTRLSLMALNKMLSGIFLREFNELIFIIRTTPDRKNFTYFYSCIPKPINCHGVLLNPEEEIKFLPKARHFTKILLITFYLVL